MKLQSRFAIVCVAAALGLVVSAAPAVAQTTITTSTTVSGTANYSGGLVVGSVSPGPTLTIDTGAAITATRGDASSFIVGTQTNPYGTVIQNGGSVVVGGPGSIGQLYLGQNVTSGNTGYTGSASYTLNAGTITLGGTDGTTGILGIGRSSDATFTQNGGSITAYRNDTLLFIGSAGGNTGSSYTLTGGTFEGIGTTGATAGGLGVGSNINASSSGTLTINGAGATVAVQPGNANLTTNGGTATVNLLNGTLALNGEVTRGTPNSGRTPGAVSFTLGGGTLRPYSTNLVVGSSTAANTAAFDITLAPSTTSTITGVGWKSGTSHTVTMVTPLIGSGNIEFSGGTVSLTAASTYSGTTSVSGGTLSLAAGGSFANSTSISVASGATLSLTGKTSGFTFGSGQTLGGSGSVALPTSGTGVSLAGFLAPGGGSAGTLAFTNAGTFSITSAITSQTGRLQFGLGPTGASDLVTVASGTLAIGSGLLEFNDFDFMQLGGFGQGTYTLFSAASLTGSLGTTKSGSIGSLTGTLEQVGNTIQLVVVPEPGTVALAGLGVAAAAWALRRHRSRR
jgi:hypothetical protein